MSTITEQGLDSVDLADPAVWDDGVPYDLFARLQREAPVHFSPQKVAPAEGGFWSNTRAEDDPVPRRDINVKADRAAVRARCVALSMVDEELGRPVRPVVA